MELDYGRKIASLIDSERPNLVLSANAPTEAQLFIARACARAGISFVPWVQDFYGVAVAKLLAKKLPVVGHLIGWWYKRLENQVLRNANGVVAITDDFVPMLQQAGVAAERISVIPNWAPLDELPVRPRRNPWSAAHGLAEKFVFLYAGTLGLKHNPDLLCQLAIAFRGEQQIRVVVITEGPGAELLRHLKSTLTLNNLDLLPFQPFDLMPDVLASADVLVAILEPDAGVFSVPSKVLTYHCASRPILGAIPSTNLATRIISETQSGLCADPVDVSGFLRAARALWSDKGAREKHGKAARAYAEKYFDIKRIADRFEGIFAKI